MNIRDLRDYAIDDLIKQVWGNTPLAHIKAYGDASRVADLLEQFLVRCLEDMREDDFHRVLGLRVDVQKAKDLLVRDTAGQLLS